MQYLWHKVLFYRVALNLFRFPWCFCNTCIDNPAINRTHSCHHQVPQPWMCAKMSMASQPLIELLRNTPPPPLAGRQESVRPIPPPPLCPPPLTILKMVPPPPLPSHLARMCPPSVMQVNTGQMMVNNSYSSTVPQRTLKGGTETNYQDAGRMQAKRGPSKPARPIHCSTR